jgi:hypothetical protein
MYFFYDLLNDIMLLGILALGFCLVYAVALIVLELPRLVFAPSRRLMDPVIRAASALGGMRMKYFFNRTTHGHRGA